MYLAKPGLYIVSILNGWSYKPCWFKNSHFTIKNHRISNNFDTSFREARNPDIFLFTIFVPFESNLQYQEILIEKNKQILTFSTKLLNLEILIRFCFPYILVLTMSYLGYFCQESICMQKIVKMGYFITLTPIKQVLVKCENWKTTTLISLKISFLETANPILQAALQKLLSG